MRHKVPDLTSGLEGRGTLGRGAHQHLSAVFVLMTEIVVIVEVIRVGDPEQTMDALEIPLQMLDLDVSLHQLHGSQDLAAMRQRALHRLLDFNQGRIIRIAGGGHLDNVVGLGVVGRDAADGVMLFEILGLPAVERISATRA